MITDIYYRGYRLTTLRQGTPTEKVHIHAMGDPELVSIVPDAITARNTIDSWLEAK
jgi:hypothetical protein